MLSLKGVVMAPVDDNVPMLGHRDAKLDLEKLSAPVTGLRPVDGDATTGNSRTEFFETLHLRSDLGSDLLPMARNTERRFGLGSAYRTLPRRRSPKK